MKKIVYTEHLRLRLKLRRIPDHYPKETLLHPEQFFDDTAEGYSVAVKKMPYNNKERNMMIVFEVVSGEVCIITIHPITDEKMTNRIMSGRWVKK